MIGVGCGMHSIHPQLERSGDYLARSVFFMTSHQFIVGGSVVRQTLITPTHSGYAITFNLSGLTFIVLDQIHNRQ